MTNDPARNPARDRSRRRTNGHAGSSTARSTDLYLSSRARRAVAIAMTITGTLTALLGGMAPAPVDAAVRRVPFHQYQTCPKLLQALRDLTLPHVGPYGLSGPYYPAGSTGGPQPKTAVSPMPAEAASGDRTAANTAAPSAAPAPAVAAGATPTAAQQANSSATNVQEAGVDEGDTVENDGRYLYGAVGGLLRIIDTTTGAQVAELGRTNGTEQLLLDGDRLAVVAADYNGYPETIVTLWDVTDRTLPRRLSETHLEGSPLAVRNVKNRARIVLQTGFAQRLKFVRPSANDEKSLIAAQNANRRIVKTSSVGSWLPRSYVVRGNGQPTPVQTAINCREVGRPDGNVGLGFTWVATVDLNVPGAREGGRGSGGVIAGGQVVYASAGNLFVATTEYTNSGPVPIIVSPQFFSSQASTKPVPRVVAPKAPSTAIHMFDLTPPDGATYRASGSVAGTLLNQFSMSEWEGRLRVATTTQRAEFGTQQASGVHILQRRSRTLKEIGVIDGLGKNERIYAVRFVGDLGYVVTFRQTDPLYVLDLRNPASPQLVGELKIPGYSSYLQPIGPGRLLGIGQDATDGGRVQGTQLSLFDVSDPRDPKRLANYRIGGTSQAEYDHRAFLWWPATRDVIVPFNTFNPSLGIPENGVVVASVSDTGIAERGRIIHETPITVPITVATTVTTLPGAPTGAPVPPLRPRSSNDPIQRSMIVNGNLLTISPNAVKSSDLAKLGPLWYYRAG